MDENRTGKSTHFFDVKSGRNYQTCTERYGNIIIIYVFLLDK